MTMMKDTEEGMDPQLWYACAGAMVQMPAVNSMVYYFPQGQAEHAHGHVNFGSSPQIPSLILCRVQAIKYMADREDEEVFAKISLVPVRPSRLDYYSSDDGMALSSDAQEKPASFAKTLTQSDANNGGGFSVPRYCADTIFPKLDYSAEPPVQTVLAKDVHGEFWKFRHIYRGTPRRHLLTTGWSTFVNHKKLVAGDSIVFLRADNGDLCVGIRRAKRGIYGGPESPSGWNPPANNCVPSYGGFSVFLREEDSKMMKNNGSGVAHSGGNIRGKGKVRPESVIEAATLAANGQPFEVVYYPRAGTPEFCVKAAAVKEAMGIQWCTGMKFKMAFDTEDSARISWFMGTVSSVQFADPIRWPNSPWRLLQVAWEEPDLLQNVKCVSPWLAELVSNIPAIHLPPFSSPRKRLRIPPHPDFPLDGQLPIPSFSANPLGTGSSPLCFIPDNTPAGIQGARHAQFGVSLSDIHLNNLQSNLFHSGRHRLDRAPPQPRMARGLIVGSPTINDVSCLLSIGSPRSTKKSCSGKPHLMLFGQQILTEEQISQNCSMDIVSHGNSGNSSSDVKLGQKSNIYDGSGSAVHQNVRTKRPSYEGLPWYREQQAIELGLQTGHCKVFMESEDVGQTLDISVLGSYEELYGKLGDMFGIEKSKMMSHVLYRDMVGTVKHTGDEPFSEFMRTARRLTILTDLSSDNIGRFYHARPANLIPAQGVSYVAQLKS